MGKTSDLFKKIGDIKRNFCSKIGTIKDINSRDLVDAEEIKCLLILWLQSPPAVILEPKKIKSLIISIVSPSIVHEVMGPDAVILVV